MFRTEKLSSTRSVFYDDNDLELARRETSVLLVLLIPIFSLFRLNILEEHNREIFSVETVLFGNFQGNIDVVNLKRKYLPPENSCMSH